MGRHRDADPRAADLTHQGTFGSVSGFLITVKRPQLALLLVFAFLLAILAPVRESWSCPDGTPCVHDRAHGFVCVSKVCGAGASCCVARTVLCKHGAWPGLPALNNLPTGRPAITTPDTCRFRVTAPPTLTALSKQPAKLLVLAPAVLPAAPTHIFSVTPCMPAWLTEYTLGYRPPPLLPLGPSRAPPTA